MKDGVTGPCGYVVTCHQNPPVRTDGSRERAEAQPPQDRRRMKPATDREAPGSNLLKANNDGLGVV